MYGLTDVLKKLHVFLVRFSKLNGLYGVAEFNDGGRVPRRILQQFLQPGSFKAEPDTEYNIGIRDLGNVPGPGLKPVGVGPCGYQAEHLHPVAAHVLSPVCNEAGSSDHLDHCGFSPTVRVIPTRATCNHRNCQQAHQDQSQSNS